MGELLRRARELELVARRNVSALLAGNYRTTIPGRGLEFHEARKYVAGDPVRQIDWNMTARLGEPHVKTFLEEREREVVIALDVSPSMALGWQERSKLEIAVEIAATLAVSAVEAGDRLGWVLFADRVLEAVPPRRGRRTLFEALGALAQRLEVPPEPCALSDPRSAIHAVQAWRGRRFVLFVISDFLDHDVPEDLAYVQRRHDVSLLHVYDPLEVAPPGPVRLLARPPEGSGGPRLVRPGTSGGLADVAEPLARAAARLGIACVSISTVDPVARRLAAFFHRRRTARG